MKPIYHLKGILFRQKRQKQNLIIVNELFKDKDLIEARKKAFCKFRSYLEVFLESLDKSYLSHEQATVDLQDFVCSHTTTVVKTHHKITDEIDTDYDKGLCLYLIEDENDSFQTQEGETVYNKSHLLLCFDNRFTELEEYIKHGLEQEMKLYKKLGLSSEYL